MKKLLFLGGTCAGSLWREKLIPLLDTNKIDYHNPVITGRPWTPEDNIKEIEMRAKADYKLYVITPKMQGVLAIAEATFDACKSPEKTLFCYLPEDDGIKFADHQIKSLNATVKLIKQAGAQVFINLENIADYLNQ